VTVSPEAQRARDTTNAWLSTSRQAERLALASGGLLGSGTRPRNPGVTVSPEAS
jgi:hypothetical protein